MKNQSLNILFTTGEEDFWGRLIYKNEKSVQFIEVDGVPHYITKDYGEPISPLKNYIILEDISNKIAIQTSDLFARKCSFSNQGINIGFVFCNGDFYCKTKAKAKDLCLENGYTSLDDAYKDEYYYYTSWEDIDLEEEGIGYDKNGNEYHFYQNKWYRLV